MTFEKDHSKIVNMDSSPVIKEINDRRERNNRELTRALGLSESVNASTFFFLSGPIFPSFFFLFPFNQPPVEQDRLELSVPASRDPAAGALPDNPGVQDTLYHNLSQ